MYSSKKKEERKNDLKKRKQNDQTVSVIKNKKGQFFSRRTKFLSLYVSAKSSKSFDFVITGNERNKIGEKATFNLRWG